MVLLLLICLSIKEVNHERIRKTSFGRLHFGTVLDSRPVYTWVFTPDLIPHEGVWYCEELDATWDLNTSSGTIQVNGKQEAFVSLHQFYCNLFFFETEDGSRVFDGTVVRAARSKIVVKDENSGKSYIFLRQDTKGERP